METEISYNRFNFFAKLVFEMALIGIGIFIILQYSLDQHKNNSMSILYFVLFFMFLIIIALVNLLNIIYLPIGVSFDNSIDKLKVKYPFNTKQISSSDIDGYSKTILVTKGGRDEGIIIHLRNGRLIVLSTFNLVDYKPIVTFLEDYNIKNIGEEKYSMLTYLKANMSKQAN